MQRLVRFDNAEGRQTPILLLADLRAIDPTVELVYVGAGEWWLGSVRANEERASKGRLILEQMDKLEQAVQHHPAIIRNRYLGSLLTQGFARIAAYVGPDPFGVLTVKDAAPYETQMVEDFRQRDFFYRRDQGKEQLEAVRADLRGDAQKAEDDANFRQYLLNDGRDHWHRQMRDRKTFGRGGMTGGSGNGLIIAPR